METQTEPMSVVTFRLDGDTYIKLLAIAEREDRTLSDVIRQSLNYYMKQLS